MTAKMAEHFPQETVVLRLHTYGCIFTITLWGWLYHNPYFIKRETEAQGGKVTCFGSQSQQGEE